MSRTPTDVDLVRRLLTSQHPRWADLPVRPVASGGTDNDLYRLGDDLVVRLPVVAWSVDDVAKEQRWLPVLAPHLPLAVPVPVAAGVPDEGFAAPWSVYRWLPGQDASATPPEDPVRAARGLAAFVQALHAVDATGAPLAGPSNRGVALAARDAPTRTALASLTDELDVGAGLALWQAALSAAPHAGPPAWVHGDLHPGNLLVDDGRLTGVLDFGSLSCGDPAVDLLPAWHLEPDARQAYRDALQVDDDAWLRGRGWGLSVAVVALAFYREPHPLVATSRHVVAQVLADQTAPSRSSVAGSGSPA
ncbi:MAG: aminoglycoside phosphotransferase [Frankiales bacterium]|nr:aminoglycoside phosphotransferase [Frankiales bacterium]